ncbi:hypothetical protein D3C75_1087830 [compost metagenome]
MEVFRRFRRRPHAGSRPRIRQLRRLRRYPGLVCCLGISPARRQLHGRQPDVVRDLGQVTVPVQMQGRIMGIHIERNAKGSGTDAEMTVFSPVGNIRDPVIADA